MSIDIYYTAPSNAMFQDIKKNAITIWGTYDDTYGYASEKIETIQGLTNVRDNYMYIFSMFDDNNQATLLALVKPETADRIREALDQ